MGTAGQDGGISEIASIAELFLSGIREGAGGGRARPVRVPPRQVGSAGETGAPVGGQVEPGAWAGAAGEGGGTQHAVGESGQPGEAGEFPGVWVVVGGHVGGAWSGRVVGEVVRALVGEGKRVGVLERVDGRVRLGLVDGGLPADSAEPAEAGTARELLEAVRELSADVEGWVVWTDDVRSSGVVLGSAAMASAAGGRGGGWVVPVVSGEDGRVDAYRAIKSLASRVGAGGGGAGRARLVLAAVGEGAMGVVGQLREVMRKFLAWDAADAVVVDGEGGSEVHALMSAVVSVAEWGELQRCVAEVREQAEPCGSGQVWRGEVVGAAGVADVQAGREQAVRGETVLRAVSEGSDVIDLAEEGPEGVLGAVVSASQGWADCEVAVPAGVACRVMADGEGSAVLVAVVGGEDREFVQVGRAVGWLSEHLGLVARAARPVVVRPERGLRVMVYVPTGIRGQVSGLVRAGVEVLGYRSLRWGGRLGLLVEAA